MAYITTHHPADLRMFTGQLLEGHQFLLSKKSAKEKENIWQKGVWNDDFFKRWSQIVFQKNKIWRQKKQGKQKEKKWVIRWCCLLCRILSDREEAQKKKSGRWLLQSCWLLHSLHGLNAFLLLQQNAAGHRGGCSTSFIACGPSGHQSNASQTSQGIHSAHVLRSILAMWKNKTHSRDQFIHKKKHGAGDLFGIKRWWVRVDGWNLIFHIFHWMWNSCTTMEAFFAEFNQRSWISKAVKVDAKVMRLKHLSIKNSKSWRHDSTSHVVHRPCHSNFEIPHATHVSILCLASWLCCFSSYFYAVFAGSVAVVPDTWRSWVAVSRHHDFSVGASWLNDSIFCWKTPTVQLPKLFLADFIGHTPG